MSEFLNSYGIWIILGLLFLLMLRSLAHGGGGCCGSGYKRVPVESEKKDGQQNSDKHGSCCH